MKKLLLIIPILIMSITTTKAQENLSYQFPAESILQLADYQRPPAVTIDSKKEYMLLSYRDTYKSLNDLTQQEISLAGLRVNPITNISSSTNYITNLKIRKVSDDEAIQVKGLPAQPRITYLTWSPDETKVAFTNTTLKELNYGQWTWQRLRLTNLHKLF